MNPRHEGVYGNQPRYRRSEPGEGRYESASGRQRYRELEPSERRSGQAKYREPEPPESRTFEEEEGYGRMRGRMRPGGRRPGFLRSIARWLGSTLERWAERGDRAGEEAMGEIGEWAGRAERRVGRWGERAGRRLHQRGQEMQEGERGAQYPSSHVGQGPKNYQRPDESIHEEVCELLAIGDLDAREIEVEVQDGEVTLRGTVDRRDWKRMAEDLAEQVSGVHDVQNQVRCRHRDRGNGHSVPVHHSERMSEESKPSM
jgi:osmotically-inducible protein OsmY